MVRFGRRLRAPARLRHHRLPDVRRQPGGQGTCGLLRQHGRERSWPDKTQYANFRSALLAKLVDYVVKNTEDVGKDFAEEARKIHYGESPERKIRGTASNQQVTELRDEGIEVVALPVTIPAGKSH
jgi:hypothetical protein